MTQDKMPKKKGHRAKGYKKIPIIVTTDGGDLAEPSLDGSGLDDDWQRGYNAGILAASRQHLKHLDMIL